MLPLVLFVAACAMPKNELTPLVDAARSGDAAAVRTLCAAGADPDARAGSNGWTPLLHAIHTNHPASAAALLEAGADANAPTPEDMTPLMMAAGYGRPEMVALLLRHGATAAQRDLDGAVALDYALTGITDVDDFTFFRCQNDTVALLRQASPPPQTSSIRWAHLKGCL